MSAAQSINKLFKEPFEPQWMKRKREAKQQQDLEDYHALLTRVEYGFRASAKESRERIAAKYAKRKD